MRIRLFSLILCALVLFSLTIYAHAYVLPKTFDDLVTEADLVLEGTVGEKRSEWAEDRSTIYTFITLFELEVIDGTYPESSFTLRMDGGEVEEGGRMKGLKVSDTPEFEVGERVILFVENNTSEICPLVGWGQGAFKVKKDPTHKKDKLFRSQNGDEIAGIDNSTGSFLTEPPASQDNVAAPELVDDDLVANEMRRKHEQEIKKEEQENKLRSKEFTPQDFKRLIRDKADALRTEGKKYPRMSQSADIRVHRKGSTLKHAQLPQEGRGADQ